MHILKVEIEARENCHFHKSERKNRKAMVIDVERKSDRSPPNPCLLTIVLLNAHFANEIMIPIVARPLLVSSLERRSCVIRSCAINVYTPIIIDRCADLPVNVYTPIIIDRCADLPVNVYTPIIIDRCAELPVNVSRVSRKIITQLFAKRKEIKKVIPLKPRKMKSNIRY